MSTEAPRNWTEKYDVEKLPEGIRHRFTRMLKAAAISDEGFRALKERLEIPLFTSSDTLLKQLRHIAAHTYANVQVIKSATDESPGQLTTYNYTEQFPDTADFGTMQSDELLQILDQSIGELYSALHDEKILFRKVQKPWQKPITVIEAVGDLSEHFYLHAQSMIDYYEKWDVPRSSSMRAALG